MIINLKYKVSTKQLKRLCVKLHINALKSLENLSLSALSLLQQGYFNIYYLRNKFKR